MKSRVKWCPACEGEYAKIMQVIGEEWMKCENGHRWDCHGREWERGSIR